MCGGSSLSACRTADCDVLRFWIGMVHFSVILSRRNLCVFLLFAKLCYLGSLYVHKFSTVLSLYVMFCWVTNLYFCPIGSPSWWSNVCLHVAFLLQLRVSWSKIFPWVKKCSFMFVVCWYDCHLSVPIFFKCSQLWDAIVFLTYLECNLGYCTSATIFRYSFCWDPYAVMLY